MQVSGLVSRQHSWCGLYVEVERGRGDCSPTPAQQARHGSGCRAAAATQHVERYRRWGNIISSLLPLFLFTLFFFLPSSLFINYLLFQSYLPSPLSKSLRINYFQCSYTQVSGRESANAIVTMRGPAAGRGQVLSSSRSPCSAPACSGSPQPAPPSPPLSATMSTPDTPGTTD